MATSKKQPVLEVQNITKKFGRFTAINDLSLSVNKGEVFGFLGPNGAGKTTTIRIILNVLRANRGYVNIFGESNKKVRSVHKRIGFLSGDMVLESDLKAKQYLNFINHKYGGDYDYRIDELADLFEIDLNKRIGSYSRGNEQKVGLIAAVLHKPDLLILDEPTSGFDPLMQENFAKLIMDYKKQGGSVLLSSHILSEVQSLCDRVGFIKEGEIIGVKSLAGLANASTKRVIIYPDGKLDSNTLRRYKLLAGLSLIKRSNTFFTFSYSGDTKKLLRFFASQNIKDILIEEPDLEEVFLEFYKSNDRIKL